MHESIDEMKHAGRLIERILFLDGLPNLQNLGKIMIGEDVKDYITCDLKLEMIARPDLKVAITCCEEAKDYVSRDLLKEILESEEEHIDWLETQLQLIDRVGIQNYQQSQMEVKSAHKRLFVVCSVGNSLPTRLRNVTKKAGIPCSFLRRTDHPALEQCFLHLGELCGENGDQVASLHQPAPAKAPPCHAAR